MKRNDFSNKIFYHFGRVTKANNFVYLMNHYITKIIVYNENLYYYKFLASQDQMYKVILVQFLMHAIRPTTGGFTLALFWLSQNENKYEINF